MEKFFNFFFRYIEILFFFLNILWEFFIRYSGILLDFLVNGILILSAGNELVIILIL